jgi:hypothetical protein
VVAGISGVWYSGGEYPSATPGRLVHPLQGLDVHVGVEGEATTALWSVAQACSGPENEGLDARGDSTMEKEKVAPSGAGLEQ